MFEKILLPVDLSDRHQGAIDFAAKLVTRSGGTITLLHVIETIAGLSFAEEKDFYNRLENAARSHLEKLGKILEYYNVVWRADVRYGHRASESARHAVEVAADLIILTAPQIDSINSGIGGVSMSYKISVLSPCPVLLVK